jgi:hypothetical protein
MRVKNKILILLGVCFFWTFTPVSADMAPPAQPPGSLPEPAIATKVQMVAETVDIRVHNSGPLYYGDSKRMAVNASVVAKFSMKNQGKSDEKMKARFPLSNYRRWGDGYSGNPEIQDFNIQVDEKDVQWTVSEEPQSAGKESPFVRWANFSITFPAGTTVEVEVSYKMQSTGWLPLAEFGYILETGAGWYGPIGNGVINLILPYDAAPGENVNLRDSSPGSELTNENSFSWSFSDLEPTPQDNWHVEIIAPETWRAILNLREKSFEGPGNETWLTQLIEKYAAIIYGKGLWVINPGYMEMAMECRTAFEKLIEIKADDARIAAEYAGLLYAIHQNPDSSAADKPSIEDIYHALNQAYWLDPENVEVSQLYEELKKSDTQLPPLGIKSTPQKIIATTQAPPPSKSIFDPVENLLKDEEQVIFLGLMAIALFIAGFVVGTILNNKSRK